MPQRFHRIHPAGPVGRNRYGREGHHVQNRGTAANTVTLSIVNKIPASGTRILRER